MKAMLLAAGRGERMGALTATIPKPLLDVGGERLIERQLRLLALAGVTDVVINLSYRGADIRACVGERTSWGQRVRYSDEGEPPLETGGGIIAALPLLGDAPFLLVNTDVFTDFDFSELVDCSHDNVLVLVPNPSHHSGDFGLRDDGRVTHTSPLLTYAGMARLSPALFAVREPGRQPLRPILEDAIDRAALAGLRYEGIWEDVGTPERLMRARQLASDIRA
jgi:MurNAc alpha-1-phosphate uridylyltransferase